MLEKNTTIERGAAHLTLLLLVAAIVSPAAVADEAESWSERISLSGDFRLRYEEIRQESLPDRERARYRARVALQVQAARNVEFILELATNADDPVSRNVSFDGGFTASDMGFDLAYVDWTATPNLHVLAGKMKNPLYRAGGSSMIWDSDLTPEGVALSYEKSMFFANAAHFWVEERSETDDSAVDVLQVGANIDIGEQSRLTAGASYLAYSNTIGYEPFYNGNANGNSVDLFGNYIYEYKTTELFAEFNTRLRGWPVSLFLIASKNNEVDEQDTGLAYGVKIGSAKDAGQWEASWAFQDVEADAVIGTYSDSDFGGGNTDADGHIVKARYALAKSVFVGGALFINRLNRSTGPQEDYDRVQIDIEFKFK